MMSTEVAPNPVPENEELAEDEGILREIDASVGDRKIRWKRTDSASVAKAKKKFEELKAKGYAIFRVKRERVTKFPEKNGGELVASRSPGALEAEKPEGQVEHFEPDERELVAVGPRSGG